MSPEPVKVFGGLLNKWDHRFMTLALTARSWVKGSDLGVGAAVVSPSGRGFSLGFSGLPRGVEDSDERCSSPNVKDFALVHAEVNAILNAQVSVANWSLYSTKFPCAHCTGHAIQAGISRIVAPPPSAVGRWIKHQEIAREMMYEAGMAYAEYPAERLQLGPHEECTWNHDPKAHCWGCR